MNENCLSAKPVFKRFRFIFSKLIETEFYMKFNFIGHLWSQWFLILRKYFCQYVAIELKLYRLWSDVERKAHHICISFGRYSSSIPSGSAFSCILWNTSVYDSFSEINNLSFHVYLFQIVLRCIANMEYQVSSISSDERKVSVAYQVIKSRYRPGLTTRFKTMSDRRNWSWR